MTEDVHKVSAELGGIADIILDDDHKSRVSHSGFWSSFAAEVDNLLGVSQRIAQTAPPEKLEKVSSSAMWLLHSSLNFPWSKLSKPASDIFCHGFSLIESSKLSPELRGFACFKTLSTFFSYLEDGAIECEDMPFDELFTAIVGDFLSNCSFSESAPETEQQSRRTVLAASMLQPFAPSSQQVSELFSKHSLSYGLYCGLASYQIPAIPLSYGLFPKTPGSSNNALLLATGEVVLLTDASDFEPLFSFNDLDEEFAKRLMLKIPPNLRILLPYLFPKPGQPVDAIKHTLRIDIQSILDKKTGTLEAPFTVGEHTYTLVFDCLENPDALFGVGITASLYSGSGKDKVVIRDDLPRTDGFSCLFVFPLPAEDGVVVADVYNSQIIDYADFG